MKSGIRIETFRIRKRLLSPSLFVVVDQIASGVGADNALHVGGVHVQQDLRHLHEEEGRMSKYQVPGTVFWDTKILPKRSISKPKTFRTPSHP